MALERSVITENETRKTLAMQYMALHPLTGHVAMISPAKVAASRKRTPAFDPRIVLSKNSDGKTGKEYRADESFFSQGDAADAVFYIDSSKVELTVVFKRGKGAVVAFSSVRPATTITSCDTGKFTERAMKQSLCAFVWHTLASSIRFESVMLIRGRSITDVNWPEPSSFSALAPLASAE
jgi:hypothetical protein